MNLARKYNFKVLLLVADLLALGLALRVAVLVRYDLGLPFFEPGAKPWDELLAALPYGLLVWAFSLWTSGAYRLGLGPIEEVLRIARAVGMAFLLLLAATFFYRGFSYSRAVVLLMIPLALGGSVLLRFLARILWHQVLRLEPVQGEALVIGTGRVAGYLASELSSRRADFRVTGVVAVADSEQGGPFEGAVEVIGHLKDLDALLESGRFGAVIVADDTLSRDDHLAIAESCLRYGCRYQVVPSIFELLLDRIEVGMVGGVPLLGLRQNQITGLRSVVKRVFDIVVSTSLLLFLAPLMIFTALAIKLSSPGPVFFFQERVGLNGRAFKLMKFRSMHVHRDDGIHRDYVKRWIEGEAAVEDGEEEKTFKIKDDPRVFAFGSFIRKYSIDELPQLFNVLKGEMSLIGPRPPIPYEVEAYEAWHRQRFSTLPGITGLWQVSGRNRLSFDEMVSLDLEYINNWSLELDLRIALKTVAVVLSGRDAY